MDVGAIEKGSTTEMGGLLNGMDKKKKFFTRTVYIKVYLCSTGQKKVKVLYRNSTIPQEYHERTKSEP